MTWIERFLNLFQTDVEIPYRHDIDLSNETINNGSPQEPDYDYLWSTSAIDQESNNKVAQACTLIESYKSVYEQVAKKVNLPWQFIGCLHYREASCRMQLNIHNGQPINIKTTIVPKGRGPFNSWTESAVDAITFMKFKTLDHSIPNLLLMSEKFNGLGYRKRGMYSPYVWSGTNHSTEKGKYTSDGKFNPNATESQLGVACLMIHLSKSKEVENGSSH